MKTAPLVLTTLLLRFVSVSSLNLRAGDEAVKIVGERILTNHLVSLYHLAIVLLHMYLPYSQLYGVFQLLSGVTRALNCW